MTKIMIFCAGEGARWGEYLGVPKQLISINGEPLLQRTVRLLNERGFRDIEIVSHDQRLNLPGCDFFKPVKCDWIVETLLATQSCWKQKNIILLGDVFFTDNAIEKITSFQKEIHVFGRQGPSLYTGCCYGEIFALAFDQDQRQAVIKHAQIACQDAQAGGRGKLWNFYSSLAGFPVNKEMFEKKIFTKIHDFTDDMDFPNEHQLLIEIYNQLATQGRVEQVLLHWRAGFPRLVYRELRRLLKPMVLAYRQRKRDHGVLNKRNIS